MQAALRAVVSQRLLRTHTGGRVPAMEVLLNTALVADLIQKSDFSAVREAMEKSLAVGSQSFELGARAHRHITMRDGEIVGDEK